MTAKQHHNIWSHYSWIKIKLDPRREIQTMSINLHAHLISVYAPQKALHPLKKGTLFVKQAYPFFGLEEYFTCTPWTASWPDKLISHNILGSKRNYSYWYSTRDMPYPCKYRKAVIKIEAIKLENRTSDFNIHLS